MLKHFRMLRSLIFAGMFEYLNSPIEHLKHPRLSQFFVKRDDLIDPYISGNKWRKLKHILRDVEKQDKTHLVTFGGAYSNHLVATASAAARKGLKATAFVRGEQVENEMLLLCRLFGMKLIFCSRSDYQNKQELFDVWFKNDPSAYFIPEGGASREALKGCADLLAELPADLDHLFCAAGTGTTAAGLLQGIKERKLKTILHVVPVLKGGEFIKAEIEQYVHLPQQLIIHSSYHFGGYAKTNPELLKFIAAFTATHGMLVDPVYTAKLFYAIEDLSLKNELAENARIMAVHTGGLLGIFGMKARIYDVL